MKIQTLSRRLKGMGFEKVEIKEVTQKILDVDGVTISVPKEFGVVIDDLLIVPVQDGIQILADAKKWAEHERQSRNTT